MNTDILNFFETATREQQVMEERARLREESRDLRNKKKEQQKNMIRALGHKFRNTMINSTWEQNNYIHNNYSDEFTRFVHRNRSYYSYYSQKHHDAVEAFKTAWENMNRIFVDEMIGNPDFLEQIAETAGLKNIKDMQTYINRGKLRD
jgi:hypothetical protein